MVPTKSIRMSQIVSVLGYCLLPLAILAFVSILITLNGTFGFILSSKLCMLTFAALAVAWCTHSASLIFVKVLDMHHQRALVAYPVALLYTCFALITAF